jgi:hypothetical protein
VNEQPQSIWVGVAIALLSVLGACRSQHEQLLWDLEEGLARVGSLPPAESIKAKGMIKYGFSYEYIMVYGWLNVEKSDIEKCSSNLDLTMQNPSDITKLIGIWCSANTQTFTTNEGGDYYATTSICNEGNQVGLLFFQRFHDPGFAEATLIYKNLATKHRCTYELALISDIMLHRE